MCMYVCMYVYQIHVLFRSHMYVYVCMYVYHIHVLFGSHMYVYVCIYVYQIYVLFGGHMYVETNKNHILVLCRTSHLYVKKQKIKVICMYVYEKQNKIIFMCYAGAVCV
jgi:hypothetical protein